MEATGNKRTEVVDRTELLHLAIQELRQKEEEEEEDEEKRNKIFTSSGSGHIVEEQEEEAEERRLLTRLLSQVRIIRSQTLHSSPLPDELLFISF
ncbi:hypothetical protein MRB53_007879 [Persea americana]|uniref:Uncharacterized protein n=1 Tax=Persea americana TaxID=3435 RepID=A0ACC2ML53_PERAE|nr:hypothetical protein MRB53_007879 [Persea americana]